MHHNAEPRPDSKLFPRRLPWFAAVLLCLAPALPAQDTKYPPQGQQFPGPPTKADTADWLKETAAVSRRAPHSRRTEGRSSTSGPEFEWAQSSFMQPQSMIEDRYFYDPAARRYTVDRFLADLDKRYGGIDSVCSGPSIPTSGSTIAISSTCCATCPAACRPCAKWSRTFTAAACASCFRTMPWDMGTACPSRAAFPKLSPI